MLFIFFLLLSLCGSYAEAADQDDVIMLKDGYFYWNRYLSPQEAHEIDQGEPIRIGLWDKISPEAQTAQSVGFGAYKIPLPKLPPGLYELNFSHIASAADIWIVPLDKTEESINLRIGRVWTPLTPEIPLIAKPVVSFRVASSSQSWVVIVNSSNHARYRAGMWHPIQLAPYPQLSIKNRQQAVISFFCSGAMSIMLLYQAMIFFRRRTDWGALALAAICLCIIMRNAGVESYLFEWIREPTRSWVHEITIKLEYIPIVAAPTSTFWFLVATYREVKPLRWTFPLAVGLGCLLILFALLSSSRMIEGSLRIFQLTGLFISIGCLIQIIRALMREARGSLFTLVGILVPLLLGSFEGYLYVIGKGTNLTTYGAVFFIFMQSQVLAQRFAATFRKAEHLGRELTKEVEKQTSQIKHIMRHVPEGIGVLDRSLCLNAVYSDFMGLLFKGAALTSQRFDSIICQELKMDESSRHMFPSTLESLIGDSHLTWEMNAHLLLGEARTKDNREFTFDWNPIVRGNAVEEVLVIVRDVTEINKLRLQSKAREAEFEYYLAFSRMKRLTVLQFQSNAIRLKKELMDLAKNPGDSKLWSRQVLICLHTLKGNFRQCGIHSLANFTHEAEQAIIDASGDTPRPDLSREILNDFIQQLEESLGAIQLVMDRLYTGLDAAESDQTLSTILKDQFQTLWTQHRKPGQSDPIVSLDGPINSITSPLREAFIDVWSHLVTNSFDHGFKAVNTDEVFSVQLVARHEGEALVLEYSDSGRGLPLDEVFKKAERLGVIPDGFDPSPENIARLIFVPGFSTRDEVSQSSGRGIGMDAVKTRLEQAGARVDLKLQTPHERSMFRRFSITVLCQLR